MRGGKVIAAAPSHARGVLSPAASDGPADDGLAACRARARFAAEAKVSPLRFT